ncbi:MAG: ATP synthase F1 subunit delta [Acidobacteria bacterium]|nr:ATP synthase F1 subunit delta [Acidobacteriota bacterium]
MRDPTIARNYAEALFELGERQGETEHFLSVMAALAGAIELEPSVRVAIESPQVPKASKEQILRGALEDVVSESFLRFLAAVIKRGRQGLLPIIGTEYADLVDEKLNRVRAGVTLAREPDDALRDAIRERLREITGKEVILRFREDPGILGGVILRIGDRIIDGSLRRRMARLRQQLLNT